MKANMDYRKIDALIHQHVFRGFKKRGKVYLEIDLPHYSQDVQFALGIMKKLDMALVPQSSSGEEMWMACDVSEVQYTKGEVKIIPKEDTQISAPTIPLAICLSALMSARINIEEFIHVLAQWDLEKKGR
jgi:hypothetical protein